MIDLDDLEEAAPYIAVAAVIGAVAFAFLGGYVDIDIDLDDIHDAITGESDDFELTSNETVIAVGQEKTVTMEMAPTRVIDHVAWTSSDESVLHVDSYRCDGHSAAIITGVSDGTAVLTATSGECTRTMDVTVSGTDPVDEMRVYNNYSESDRYALLEGGGFEEGVLALSFNYWGNPVISMCGYTPEMLAKSPYLTGNHLRDFSSVRITLTDDTAGTVADSCVWTHKSAHSSPILTPDGGLEAGHSYTVDFLVSSPHCDDYHVTGRFSYMSNDGAVDSTGTFERTYAWRYGGHSYALNVDFPYGTYSRYHVQNWDAVEVWKDGTSRNCDFSSSVVYFCHGNDVTGDVVDQLRALYAKQYGYGSLTGQGFADFLLGFVQICWTYEYDHYQYVDTGRSSVDYWAYPMETIYSGIGDCEDTSILTATLFRDAGYAAGIYMVPEHAISAVHIDGFHRPAMGEGDVYIGYTLTATGVKYYGCESVFEEAEPVGVTFERALSDESGQRYDLDRIKLWTI